MCTVMTPGVITVLIQIHGQSHAQLMWAAISAHIAGRVIDRR